MDAGGVKGWRGVVVVTLTQRWPLSIGRGVFRGSLLKKLGAMQYLVHSRPLFRPNQNMPDRFSADKIGDEGL